jgi:murein DD-endopeptidase MepM/ murein hydrolase activator NlpD
MNRMRPWLVLATLAVGCVPAPAPPAPVYLPPPGAPASLPAPPRVASSSAAYAPEAPTLGQLDHRLVDFAFDGGQIEIELYRDGAHVVQVARNRYAVPVMIAWSLRDLDNLAPLSPTSGVAFLPAAPTPRGQGATVVLAELRQIDLTRRYRRHIEFRARFGDPRATPTPYSYALPYPRGLAFSVLQGFHGAFSHRGSNEYAVDFATPVATPVLAARPGLVVAAGTTPEYLDYRRTNFVLVLHDDGTLGEYMHLAPSSVHVQAGDRVERLQPLALSGNTGFSSTPHLHFQVMTAATDGISARSFPFELAVAPDQDEEPVQGKRYTAWETRTPAEP